MPIVIFVWTMGIYTINAVSLVLHMLWSYKRQYSDKTLILRKYMYMGVNGLSELRKCSHVHILKCYFFQCFVGISDTLSVQMTC